MNKVLSEILRYLRSLYPDERIFREVYRKRLMESLNGQEFYELMQAYRHAPIGDQLDVASAFGEVKKFILSS